MLDKICHHTSEIDFPVVGFQIATSAAVGLFWRHIVSKSVGIAAFVSMLFFFKLLETVPNEDDQNFE